MINTNKARGLKFKIFLEFLVTKTNNVIKNNAPISLEPKKVEK